MVSYKNSKWYNVQISEGSVLQGSMLDPLFAEFTVKVLLYVVGLCCWSTVKFTVVIYE